MPLGKLLTIDAVFSPPSRNAAAKSDLKCTTSTALFNVAINSTSSASYSQSLKTFFNFSGP